MKKTMLIIAVGMIGTTFAAAQTANNGKVVKKILFDRENVTMVYADDSFDANVAAATVTKGSPETTAVKAQDKASGTKTARRWYTLDGRRMNTAPRSNSKGVYVVKEEKKVRKVVKK